MVRTEFTALLPGVMEAGLNEQARVLGSPEHANATAELKASAFGVAVTVTLAEPPAVKLIADGVVPRVRLPLAEPLVQVEVNVTGAEI